MMDSHKVLLILKNFLQMLIHIRIYVEEQCPIIKRYMKLLIILIQQIQMVGILTSLLGDYYSNDLRLQRVLLHLTKIFKPYTYLKVDDFFNEYLYLVPLGIMIIMLALAIHLFIRCRSYGNSPANIQPLLRNTYFIQYILYANIYFSIVFQKIFLITMIQMCLISFKHNYSVAGVNLTHLPFIVIGITLTLIYLGFEYCVSHESFNLKSINLKVLTQNSSNLYEIFVQLAVSLIMVLINSNYGQFYFITILLLTNSVIQLVNIYHYQVAIYQDACNIIISQSFTLSFTMIYLIFRITDVQSFEVLDSITIWLFPLILHLIMTQYIKQHNKIILQQFDVINLHQLQYQISFIIETLIDIRSSQTDAQYFIIQQYKLQHQSTCIIMACQCHKMDIQEQQIIELHLSDLVIQFNNLIQEEKDEQLKFNYFLHYLTLINLLGMNTLAFQQANTIFKRSTSQNYSDTQSGNNIKEFKQQTSTNTRIPRDCSVKAIKLTKLGFIQTCKLMIIQEQIQKQLGAQIYQSKTEGSADLSHAVRLFLLAEENNKYIISTILKLLMEKKQFLSNINSIKNGLDLYQQCLKIAQNLKQFEDNLLYQYNQFPSQKMQSINTFFQAEILNNFAKAYKLTSLNSISDEKLMKVHATSSIDLFSTKIDYLIVGFDNKSTNFKIIHTSSQMNEFFGLPKNTFQLFESIDLLLPKGFDRFHHLMVQQFLQTGKSKFFRQIDLNLCCYESNFIKPTEFFFEINQTTLNELTFVSFLKEYQTMNAYLLVGSNNKCTGFSKNIVKKFNLSSSSLDQLCVVLKRQPIHKIIPDFFQIVEQLSHNLTDDINQSDEINLYKILFNLPSIESKFRATMKTIDTVLNGYACDIVLKVRKITSEIRYYIIEIKDARKITSSMLSFYGERQTTLLQPKPSMQLPSSQNIFDDESISQEDILSIRQLDLIKPEGFVKQGIQQTNQTKMNDIYEIAQEDQISKPLDHENEYVIQIKNNLAPSETIQYMTQQQENLLSHRNSKLTLLERKQFFKRKDSISLKNESLQEQQAFYRDYKVENTKNAIDQFILQDLNIDVEEQIKGQMNQLNKDNNVDDGASQVSSIAGMRRSKFYKKYDLIDRFLSSYKFSRNFDIMMMLLFIFSLVSLVQSILFVTNSSQDFKSFNSEINILTIRNNIMGPLDKYIVCQNAAAIPILYGVAQGVYTYEVALQKSSFASSQLTLTYGQLKSNIMNQQQNPTAMQFFRDQTITVRQINLPGVDYNTIALTESLNMFLESNYQILKVIANSLATFNSNVSFFVYNYANYPTFNQRFQELNDEMLDYSINRSYQVKDRWIYTLIPFFISNFFLISVAYYFYSQFKIQYQKFLQLFYNLNDHMIQKDIDRFKGIINLVSVNEEVVFKYQFDIQLKEKFMQQESNKLDQDQKNQLKLKKKLIKFQSDLSHYALPKTKSFIVFIIIFAIYFAFNFLQNQLGLKYFNNYPSTANFFYLLSNSATASNEVFAVTLILEQNSYNPTLYYYYNDTDISYFYKQFEFNINIMNAFLSLIQNLDSKYLLTTASFLTNLTNFMITDVCQQLPSDIKELAASDCNEAYNGVLKQGYASAVVQIRNSLLNDQITSKNFTIYRVNFNVQLQAGVIASIMLDELTLQFENALLDQTNALINLNSILSTIDIIYVLLFLIIMFQVTRQYYIIQFEQVKRFTLLLPQSSLFLDLQVERQLRAIIINDNLL